MTNSNFTVIMAEEEIGDFGDGSNILPNTAGKLIGATFKSNGNTDITPDQMRSSACKNDPKSSSIDANSRLYARRGLHSVPQGETKCNSLLICVECLL
ncbi:hypothetical protein MKW98_020803 [Papaver atlanticum]|uniref:Uncharacterized protein n=1 Tax=Papaver atlanticum TaxID=357466 RepID=A0AAD4XUZ6_9MAGN|nr:hypothetical protein MKW98_020803 [Papaver atlanticum]